MTKDSVFLSRRNEVNEKISRHRHLSSRRRTPKRIIHVTIRSPNSISFKDQNNQSKNINNHKENFLHYSSKGRIRQYPNRLAQINNNRSFSKKYENNHKLPGRWNWANDLRERKSKEERYNFRKYCHQSSWICVSCCVCSSIYLGMVITAVILATTFLSTTSNSTTSTTTTTTINPNICLRGYTDSFQLLYLNMTPTVVTQYQFTYTAPNVFNLTLMFAFRNDPAYWYLDSVSVKNIFGQELLSNGDFESGSLSHWVYCNPQNATHAGQVTTVGCYNSSYCYADGSVGAFDYLSQAFSVTPYNTYTIKFWLSGSGTNGILAQISIFY